MAYVEVSNDDEADAVAVLGPPVRPTGRMRYFKALGQEPVLQCEWKTLTRTGQFEGMGLWLSVPTLTEITE